MRVRTELHICKTAIWHRLFRQSINLRRITERDLRREIIGELAQQAPEIPKFVLAGPPLAAVEEIAAEHEAVREIAQQCEPSRLEGRAIVKRK